ncbi:M48 family metallopeptidase [Mycoplasma sp. T363T]|uniref:YgjP family zinc-dependent metalloprotease n=1 Tax=Mycoplasma bradburyae TaxID=2963128 RepID=UPI0023412FC7|nr:SprT family zinc-dependent metalloprotease [Mycoplasma bradburyae]MDC4163315.1 M48 family metallopeptidase [Mycoplasma bradburyae]MDC4182634.1 M48 family metallopeptidase [Mycoplasma bradburyae]
MARLTSNNKIIRVLNYDIKIIKKKGIKNIYLKIKPPYGDIIVSCPLNCADQFVVSFVLKKLEFINKSKQKVLATARLYNNTYQDKEIIYLWNKPHKLVLIDSKHKPSIAIEDNQIIFKADKHLNHMQREKIFNNWYRKLLLQAMKPIINELELKMNIKANEYRVKNMKTKWGTCNVDKKRIWISLRLIKKPIECLLYVMVHEMVHLIETNHTKKFYKIVEHYLPNWKELNKLLKSS